MGNPRPNIAPSLFCKFSQMEFRSEHSAQQFCSRGFEPSKDCETSTPEANSIAMAGYLAIVLLYPIEFQDHVASIV